MQLKELVADIPKRSLAFEIAAVGFLSMVAVWNLSHPLPKRFQAAKAPANAAEKAVVARIDAAFDPPVSPWVAGLLLGDGSAFSKKWKETFRRTGTSHLIVVSGYAVSMVFSASQSAILRLRLSRRLRIALSLAIVGAFVLLTGSRSGALRAALMLAIASAARELFGRSLRPLRALLIAVVILVLFQPRMLTDDRGFQLSALAAFGIRALAEPLRATLFRRLPDPIGRRAALALSATVAIAPLVAWMTGSYSLVALAANVGASFFVPDLMAAGAALTGLAFVLPAAARFLAAVLRPWFMAPLVILNLLASVPDAAVSGLPAVAALSLTTGIAVWLAVRWHRAVGRAHFFHAEDDLQA